MLNFRSDIISNLIAHIWWSEMSQPYVEYNENEIMAIVQLKELLSQLFKSDHSSVDCVSPTTSVSVGYSNSAFSFDDTQIIAALQQARDIISRMPQSTKNLFMAPSHHGLPDQQSVLCLEEESCQDKTVIRIKDFLQKILESYGEIDSDSYRSFSSLDGDNVPQPLREALQSTLAKLYVTVEEEYTTIEYSNQTVSSELFRPLPPVLPPPVPTLPPSLPISSSRNTHSFCIVFPKCLQRKATKCALCAMLFSIVIGICIAIWFLVFGASKTVDGPTEVTKYANITVLRTSRSAMLSTPSHRAVKLTLDYELSQPILSFFELSGTRIFVYRWKNESNNNWSVVHLSISQHQSYDKQWCSGPAWPAGQAGLAWPGPGPGRPGWNVPGPGQAQARKKFSGQARPGFFLTIFSRPGQARPISESVVISKV